MALSPSVCAASDELRVVALHAVEASGLQKTPPTLFTKVHGWAEQLSVLQSASLLLMSVLVPQVVLHLFTFT